MERPLYFRLIEADDDSPMYVDNGNAHLAGLMDHFIGLALIA